MGKKTAAVIFGGQSSEHAVSYTHLTIDDVFEKAKAQQ